MHNTDFIVDIRIESLFFSASFSAQEIFFLNVYHNEAVESDSELLGTRSR